MAKRTAQRAPQPPEQRQTNAMEAGQSSVATLERETEQAAAKPGPNDIARRAYEIYCERGCEHGRDMDDWLRAESELKRR